METSSKRKWQIRAAVLAIFLVGALAGALALNVYHHRRPWNPRDGRRDRFEQIINRLDLSAEQRAQVEQIMKDARAQFIQIQQETQPRLGSVRQQTDDRMKAVLSPQQWEQWQQMTHGARGRRPRDRRP